MGRGFRPHARTPQPAFPRQVSGCPTGRRGLGVRREIAPSSFVLQRLVACSRLSGTRVHPLGARGAEVTAALDPGTVKEVLVTIRNLAEEGMTCVIVTREMGFAREIADQIYFTDRGVVVEHGPPEEFITRSRDERAR